MVRQATIHVRNVPPELKAKFKSRCAELELTMQQMIVKLMTEAVSDNTRNDLGQVRNRVQEQTPGC